MLLTAAAPAVHADGPTSKAVPQILKIWSAKYDGRVLALDVEVPGAGELSLDIPTRCRVGNAVDCHRKTSISRRVTERGRLIIRKQLRPRIDDSGRLNLAARMDVAGGLIVSALKPKVHLIGAAG